MRPTQILNEEHRVILRVLAALERIAEATRAAGRIPARSAADALDFLATFADRCHHGKEEELLFPALVKKGLPREVGPVAVMLAEHDEGRALVRAMRAALAGEGRPAEDFARAASEFVELLRAHIAKEDQVLFPMADGMLAEAEQAELLGAFERVEQHDLGEGTHERYLALARDLCERTGLSFEEAGEPVHAGGCCGHARGSGCH